MSYYRTINGQRYDAALLDRLQGLTHRQGDGRVSHADAQRLLAYAQDGQGITPTERQTLHYVLDQYNFTDKARTYLQQQIDQLPDTASPAMDLRFGQLARDQYEKLRRQYWQAQYEGEAGDPWADYRLGAPGQVHLDLPTPVQEALWFYGESVEQADWGSVRL